MAARHRIPTIFNLSMVDVLCCALGCVILLWLLNLRAAKQRAEEAGETSSQLTYTRARLSDTEGRLQSAERERASLSQELAAARARLSDLNKTILALRAEQADTADRLAKKTKEQLDLTKELTASRQRVDALDMLVREKEAFARATNRSVEDLKDKLRDADARLTQARSQADLVPGLREKLAASEAAAATMRKDLDKRASDLETEVAGLGRQLTDANRMLGSLREDKRVLTDQVARARAVADNRFAGIALTGKRVVFLVDMSGSMELVDENTASPEKWVGVRETLAKVMRSLPDLEKFQVILFSTKASYLLGSEDRWLDFDPLTTPSKVAEALAAIKPKGNTDMFTAFKAAFRFRAQGLDTIYLFSDGLPNIGEGLSPEAARTMKETDRAEILSKYVRRTLLNDWNRRIPGQATVRINAIGFFYESPDVGAFLWALAREHDGSFVGMSKP
jgi:hypothetical protein